MCSEDGVVGLDNRSRNFFGRVDTELELALLAVINGQTFHEKSSETRTSATAK